jgi:hypothetical protein
MLSGLALGPLRALRLPRNPDHDATVDLAVLCNGGIVPLLFQQIPNNDSTTLGI